MMVGHVIKGSAISDTHERLEEMVLSKGVPFETERGEVLELLNVHSMIRYPYIRGKHPYWHGEKLEDYIDQFFKLNDNPDPKKRFVYTYGDRILDFRAEAPNGVNGIDQLSYVYEKLARNMNTRRAVMVIYNPIMDNGVEDVPCLQHVQYQVRNRILLTTILYRSHDIDAYYPNLCGLAEISKWLAEQLGCFVGEIHVYSNNLHKYVTSL